MISNVDQCLCLALGPGNLLFNLLGHLFAFLLWNLIKIDADIGHITEMLLAPFHMTGDNHIHDTVVHTQWNTSVDTPDQ